MFKREKKRYEIWKINKGAVVVVVVAEGAPRPKIKYIKKYSNDNNKKGMSSLNHERFTAFFLSIYIRYTCICMKSGWIYY